MSLYHFSEDPHIERFVPRPVRIGPSDEALVWSVDSLHSHPCYFPRDCPRVIISTSPRTSADDAETFFGHTTAVGAIGVPYQRVNEVVLGRRPVTPSTALRLSRFFGTSPGFWMNLQLHWASGPNRNS